MGSPIISNFGQIPNSALDPSVVISDDPTNASGLSSDAIVNGVVILKDCTGVVMGTGQTSTVRQANHVAIQAAITYAEANALQLYVTPGSYEIDGTGLLFGYSGQTWVQGGPRGSSKFIQFRQNVPVATIGPPSTFAYGHKVDGMCFVYGSTQGPYSITGNTNTSTSITAASSTANLVVGQAISGTGIPANATITAISETTLTITISAAATATATGVAITIKSTSANTLVLGGISQSVLTNITVGQSSFMGYRGVWQTGANAEFQNTLAHWQVVGCQQDLVLWDRAGTGTVWSDWYCRVGGLNAPVAINGVAWGFTNGCDGGLMQRINIECIKLNNVFNIGTCRGLVMDDIHLETITLTGGFPIVLAGGTCQVTIRGFHMDFRLMTTDGASTRGRFISQFFGDVIDINGLYLISQATDSGAANLPFQIFESTASTPDSPPTLTLRNLAVLDLNSGGIGNQVYLAGELPLANYGSPSSLREYVYNAQFSVRRGAIVQLLTSTTAYTVFGAEEDAEIMVPATIAANCTITLGQWFTPSGVGSASVHPRLGNKVTVRWQAGTATRTLTVTDQQAGTNLVNAAASAGVTYVFVYTSTGYVLAT